MGRIEGIVNVTDTARASTSTSDDRIQNNGVGIATSSKQRRIKLPEAPMPTFDGKYENWLSFKNAFHNLIDSQTDLSDLDKLHYLKSALVGDAAHKVKIFTVDGINYTNAWELLERAYGVKRILVSQHLSAILNLPAHEKETTAGLSRLADEAQQHLASLGTLGISVGSEMMVHILESKLPKRTLEKWEATLKRDEIPSLAQLYEFLYKTAVCASKRERIRSAESLKVTGEPPSKQKLVRFTNKAFLTNASHNCPSCKLKRHPLYLCNNFRQLSIPKHIEMMRSANLCYNCMRSHRDRPCIFSNCTICHKPHNTFLHLEGYAKGNKPKASVTVQAE